MCDNIIPGKCFNDFFILFRARCADVLQAAILKHGKPEIFNTDQGSQFTSEVFIDLLKFNEIRISMDGKGRALGGDCEY